MRGKHPTNNVELVRKANSATSACNAQPARGEPALNQPRLNDASFTTPGQVPSTATILPIYANPHD
jgi:hypothetical protein